MNQNLDHYTREFKEVARKAETDKGIIGGGVVAWIMMLIGVVVTGTMTYSLTREGMASNALWAEFVNAAAVLPVALLEGSALALAYGRHFWFRSEAQRGLANVANWVIWSLLAITTVVHFAFGRSSNPTLRLVMTAYAAYVLPLAIVAVPMLWKKLYDLAPDSAMRAAVLDAEASLRSQLIEIQREQNALIVSEIRQAMDTPNVREARKALFEQASIEHAHNITGFISDAGEGQQPPTPPRVTNGGHIPLPRVNGATTWDEDNHPNGQRR